MELRKMCQGLQISLICHSSSRFIGMRNLKDFSPAKLDYRLRIEMTYRIIVEQTIRNYKRRLRPLLLELKISS